jgi:hypothetical protein
MYHSVALYNPMDLREHGNSFFLLSFDCWIIDFRYQKERTNARNFDCIFFPLTCSSESELMIRYFSRWRMSLI